MTWAWEPIKEAQEKTKVAPATFECTLCGKWCYTGKSKKNLESLKEQFPDKNIQMETIYKDHIDPVIPLVSGWEWSWDEIIERMFCEIENIQVICKECHDEKTKEESEIRKKLKKEK
jgi:hypothetical protein